MGRPSYLDEPAQYYNNNEKVLKIIVSDIIIVLYRTEYKILHIPYSAPPPGSAGIPEWRTVSPLLTQTSVLPSLMQPRATSCEVET